MIHDDHFPDVEVPEEVVTGVAKTIVSRIPIIGNVLLNIRDEFANSRLLRKMERFEELLSGINDSLSQLEDKVNQDYISKTDCADILERTIQAVVIERLKEKRVAYKNLLVNSIVAPNANFDRTEKYLQLLSQMTKIDILLLHTLHNPKKINSQKGNPIKDPFTDEEGKKYTSFQREYKVQDLLHNLWKFDKEDITDSMAFLFQHRLIKDENHIEISNGHPIETLENRLTEKGKEFVKFILEP